MTITFTITTELLANIFIYIAGILWGIELIPQIVHTLKTKKVDGISPSFFLICTLAYFIYTIGNIMLGNLNIVIAHIPSLVLLVVELFLIGKYSKPKKKKRKRK